MRAAWCGVLLFPLSMVAQIKHAPDGGSYERLRSIDVPVRAGAPFRAQVSTSWKRRLEDGTETTIYNRRTIARDSTGRVFEERRAFSPDGNTKATNVTEYDFDDPSMKTTTVCTVATRQCMVRHWTRPPLPADMPQLPATQTFPNGVKVSRQSLGTRNIDTLQVTGSREITTTPRLGEAEPAVKEFWYSPRLGMNLVVKRFLPRGGAQDFAVESIDQNEPDAGLFQLPKGYQVIDIPAPVPVTPAS